MKYGGPGPERQRLAYQRRGRLRVANLTRQQAKKMVGVGIAGLGADNVYIERLGPGQIAALMIAERQGQHFGGGRHGRKPAQAGTGTGWKGSRL